MNKKKGLAILLGMTLSAALFAGGNRQAAPASGGITLDNYGRTITIAKRPQKVVTAGPNCSEVFVALGLVDLIVGNSADNHSQGPLPEFAADYAKIPELTFGYPTMEAVVSSGADFIYAIDWVFGDDFSIEALEKNGITVYMCAATSYDQVWKEINDMGKIFGVEQAAQKFVRSEQARLGAVLEKVKGQEKRKVFVYDSGGDTIYTAGGPNIETLFIESAGGENIFKDLTKAWIGASYEAVLARDPYAMIIHDYDTPTAAEKIAEIKKDPRLSQLDCVKNERFIIMSLEAALPGSRTAYCVETIARGIYPELF